METTIGDFTKIQSNCYITAYMLIGDHVAVAPNVARRTTTHGAHGETLALRGADHTPRRGTGGGSVLLPAVEIGEEAFVARLRWSPATCRHARQDGHAPARLRGVPDEELLDNQQAAVARRVPFRQRS
jgi:hypothetical protein